MSSLFNYIYNSIYGGSGVRDIRSEEPVLVDVADVSATEPSAPVETTVRTVFNRYGWKSTAKHYAAHPKYSYKAYMDTHGICVSGISHVDLRPKCPAVYDQGQLGSCTANAIGFCYHFDTMNTAKPLCPSRLFIYYNERSMEGTVNTDSGAEIHDGIQSIHDVGVCEESAWGYDISKFTERPPQVCYDAAKQHTTVAYRAVNKTLDDLKSALVAGFPVVFGFIVYESFESPEVAKTGMMPMPKAGEYILGGHAVALVGFDDVRQVFIVRNSWGEGWGDRGYFYMPYAFISDRDDASDFWTVSSVSDELQSQQGSLEIVYKNESREVIRRNIAAHIQQRVFQQRHFGTLLNDLSISSSKTPESPTTNSIAVDTHEVPITVSIRVSEPTAFPAGTSGSVKRRNRRTKHKVL